ncbi:hypothetical protein SKAU_G00181620 [Synaphobranchus kaupii]|uniref:Uncharacterized protein n=1 Tax=Synaphobranchus kaupii TaxID=118154 RepID=A0A9Q1J1U4_SYNKA|nr:hypothetical protein SKAU_G00181620 [Synaphobranchus kaupii]
MRCCIQPFRETGQSSVEIKRHKPSVVRKAAAQMTTPPGQVWGCAAGREWCLAQCWIGYKKIKRCTQR